MSAHARYRAKAKETAVCPQWVDSRRQAKFELRHCQISGRQPAPDTRQPGLLFARQAGRAIIVSKLDEPGG